MQNKLNSFFALVLCSLLAHLVLATLVLQQPFVYQSTKIQPAPLQVFAVTRLPQRPPPAAAEFQSATAPAATASAVTVAPPMPAPRRTAAPAPTRVATQAKTIPVKKATVAITQPTAATATATSADHPVDLTAIFSSVQQQAARRELSAAELAALSAPRTETNTVQPSRAVRRAQAKPGSGPASDVLETLADGTQLVRVGKQCVLAAPGADLRKDIHSMKLVGCGAGGNSEQDKIDAHFEQVMSGIGQHR
ncbi:MAG: hypothetical protein U5L02_20565 [Rheinheimera sp.]|nr:hypothetical protein [Rheinheimera sp.]